MTYFKTFSRLQQFFIVFFLIGTFVALASLRHFTVAILWGAAATLTAFTPHKKDFLRDLYGTLKHPSFIFLGLFLAYAFISSCWSLKPLQSFKATLSQSATLLLMGVFLTHLRTWKEEAFTFLMKLMVLLILFSGLALIIQNIGFKSFKTMVGLSYSTLKTNITLFITLTIPVAAYLHLRHKQKVMPLLILGMAFFLCYRTKYFAGFSGVVLAGIAAGLSYKFSRLFPLIIAYGTAVLCLILPFLFHTLLPLMDLKSIWDIDIMRSFAHRLYIWDFVTEKVSEKVWLGWGAATSKGFPTNGLIVFDGSSVLPSHPHNHIMQVWLEMGLVGAAFLAALHFYIFRAISKLEHPIATAWATFFSLTVFMILSLSHSIWHKWWITWLGAMVVILVTGIQRHKKSAP